MKEVHHINQRRAIEAHEQKLEALRDVANVHQDVLQKHAQAHLKQGEARDAVRGELYAFRDRSFLGRLRWLVTGK